MCVKLHAETTRDFAANQQFTYFPVYKIVAPTINTYVLLDMYRRGIITAEAVKTMMKTNIEFGPIYANNHYSYKMGYNSHSTYTLFSRDQELLNYKNGSGEWESSEGLYVYLNKESAQESDFRRNDVILEFIATGRKLVGVNRQKTIGVFLSLELGADSAKAGWNDFINKYSSTGLSYEQKQALIIGEDEKMQCSY